MTRLSTTKQRYAHGAKAEARDLVVAAAQDIGAESILDLWGGGASARAFREALPEAAVVSCESDQQLWPALRLDAQSHGYAYHLGDFRKATGKYDLIWADLCSQWCGSARDAVAWSAAHLTKDGALALTLMAARESPEIAADRLFLVPKSIERATGMRVVLLYPYQTSVPMWLLILRGDAKWSWWMDTPERTVRIKGRNIDNWEWRSTDTGPFDSVLELMAEDGFFLSRWSADGGRLPALLDQLGPQLGQKEAA